MMKISEIRALYDEAVTERRLIEKAISEERQQLRTLKRDLVKHEEAKEVVRLVGIRTQEQLQYHISDITSLALESVFEDPYELVMEFVQRRDKTECDLNFSRDEMKVNPLDASGGGAVDVAAFALRIASWSLQRPHSRATIILDEPMKWVSEEYKDKVSSMIKEISKKLGIQFIIITHEPKLTAYADKVFEVKKRKRVSRVTESV